MVHRSFAILLAALRPFWGVSARHHAASGAERWRQRTIAGSGDARTGGARWKRTVA